MGCMTDTVYLRYQYQCNTVLSEDSPSVLVWFSMLHHSAELCVFPCFGQRLPLFNQSTKPFSVNRLF